MAVNDTKVFYDEETSQVPSAFEPASAGHVGKLRSRLPGFSLEVRQEESSFATTKSASNADFDPIPPSKRTWTWMAYVAYWMVSDSREYIQSWLSWEASQTGEAVSDGGTTHISRAM